jgi:hypothetical protein
MNALCSGLEGFVLVHDPGEADGAAEALRSSVCMTFAELYYLGVDKLGGDAFESGQRDHCRCCA